MFIYEHRVINTFKSMVVDDDVLEKEDLYILDRIKAFLSGEEVIKFAAAKQLLILLERAVCSQTMLLALIARLIHLNSNDQGIAESR